METGNLHIPSIAEIEVSVSGCLERVLLAISSSFCKNVIKQDSTVCYR